MQTANAAINQWGPALVVCLVVVLGFFYQNSRTNDTNARIADLNARIVDLNARIVDLKETMNLRMSDLKDFLKSEIKRMDERIDRVDIPRVLK